MQTKGRRAWAAHAGSPRRVFALLTPAIVAQLCWVPSGLADASLPADQSLTATGIRNQQLSVVAANHQGPLNAARFAVADFSAATAQDSQALAADRAAQATAATRAAEAAARVAGDQEALARSTAALGDANDRLTSDRNQLRVIAIGMYTGALTNPQPASLRDLQAEQTKVIDATEVELVAEGVDRHVHADLQAVTSDRRRKDRDATQLASDRSTEARETADSAASAARTATDEKTLSSDQAKLDRANRQLAGQEVALTSALSSVAGPTSTPAGQLSILGGAALTPAQMVGWYRAQGYVDFTSAPIDQLAAWYIQAGAEEGVRGDVAFAQAVLETGGFSSPDAVDLSNFAGIGHCDTCASGWAFPSPQAGVLGQVQLLRIFADSGPGPANAPPPALPTLRPGLQMSAGRCPTVESLTGVWATDPSYAQSILLIYGQMLSYALASGPSF